MHTQDDAAAMAFAVLRNRGYRFLAVSTNGVVVSNGSPTLAIDVSQPVAAPALNSEPHANKKLRMPAAFIQKATDYKRVMADMNVGDAHTFDLVAGSTVQGMAMTLANACYRYWGKGKFSIKSSPNGITVTRK